MVGSSALLSIKTSSSIRGIEGVATDDSGSTSSASSASTLASLGFLTSGSSIGVLASRLRSL
jgi:hypothetical protein